MYWHPDKTMKDIEVLRGLLEARRRLWKVIASDAKVGLRTIYRIMSDPYCNPTMETVRRLTKAARAIRAPRRK